MYDTNNSVPLLAVEQTGGTTTRRYVYGNGLISMNTGGGDYYVAHDAQGSVVAVTAGNGTTEASYSYDAFGNQLAATTQSGAPSIPLRYEGEYLDPTGLYHLQARQYDPTSGTFTAQDPATADPKSPAISLYSYVGNQPTVLEDPTGEFSLTAAWSAVGSVASDAAAEVVSGGKPVLKAVGKDVAVGVQLGYDVGTTITTCSSSWSSVACGQQIQQTGVDTSGFLVGTVCDAVTAGFGSVACNAAVAAGGQFLLDRYGVKSPSGSTDYTDATNYGGVAYDSK